VAPSIINENAKMGCSFGSHAIFGVVMFKIAKADERELVWAEFSTLS